MVFKPTLVFNLAQAEQLVVTVAVRGASDVGLAAVAVNAAGRGGVSFVSLRGRPAVCAPHKSRKCLELLSISLCSL